MKNYRTFEEKINQSFKRYGRLPIIGLAVLLFIYLSWETLNKTTIQPRLAQRAVKQQFQGLYDEILTVINEFEEDDDYQELMSSDNSGNYRLAQLHYRLSQRTGLNIDYALYDDKGDSLYLSRNIMVQTAYMTAYNRFFTERIKGIDKNQLQLGSLSINSVSETYNTLMFGKAMHYGNNQTGVILVYIDPASLVSYVDQFHVSHIVVTDQYGYVVASSSPSFVGRLGRFNSRLEHSVSIDNMDYRDTTFDILHDQLTIHTLRLKRSFLDEFGLLISFILLTIATVTIAYSKVARKVGKEVSMSIKELVFATRQIIDGELGYQTSIKSDDELGFLIEQFNLMSSQLDAVMKRNEQLIELRKDAQIKQLEAQFNPHFLYNSLETIRYLLVDEREAATQMIIDLTYLLRYSIDATRSEVTFETDMEYVKRYLNIIKVRLNERFTYELHIDSALMDQYIPRLLLQPLIENSVKHGFRHKETLNVSVYAFGYDDDIYIEVTDDGGGFDESKLNEVIYNMMLNQNPKNSFGLHNIYQRLKLLYGDNGDLRITSHNHCTHIVIRIPKEKKSV